MSHFRFKQFSVKNEISAMKVNTDGVILGAATSVFPEDRNIVDIGTGTGTIALMLAQRTTDTDARILGIDIDRPSFMEAEENFSSSTWNDRLSAGNISFTELNDSTDKFDIIVSNPPYFDNSLQNPDERKKDARHTKSTDDNQLSFRTLINLASSILSEKGHLSMIVPADFEDSITREAEGNNLHIFNTLRIKPTEKKPVSRIVFELCRKENCLPKKDSTIIIQEKGKYTRQYISLIKDFYIWA